jgi:hypothetical protein
MPDHPAVDLVRQLAAERDELEQLVTYMLTVFDRLIEVAACSSDPETRQAALDLGYACVRRATAVNVEWGKAPQDVLLRAGPPPQAKLT